MMTVQRRGFLGRGALALATAGLGVPARAETFPSKPIRWIIPFAAGGNYDVTSRIVGEAMGRQLNQTILIDNRPGAGGVVGLEVAALAPADGYTIVMASFSVLYVSPVLAGKPPMVSAFAPISLLTTVPTLAVTNPRGRFVDMRALLAEAKAKPGTVTMGHSGNGTNNHVDILRLQLHDGIKFNIIPYKGAGPGINDLLAGTIDCFVDQLTSSMPHIQSGQLKPLAVFTPERIPALPDVPTFKELGSLPYDGGTTAAVLAPAGTSKDVIARLNEAAVAALKEEGVVKRLGELGAVVRPTTPEQVTEAFKSDEVNVAELLKLGLLKPE
jgi:tripartite-type tricarboxylate transporter receptor subunit TctC